MPESSQNVQDNHAHEASHELEVNQTAEASHPHEDNQSGEASQPTRRNPGHSPNNTMTTTDRIIQITREVTQMGGEIQPETSFHEIGLDSLDMLDLVAAIEEYFEVEMDDGQIEQSSTPELMAKIIDQLMP
jgi:acyl carrier protein